MLHATTLSKALSSTSEKLHLLPDHEFKQLLNVHKDGIFSASDFTNQYEINILYLKELEKRTLSKLSNTAFSKSLIHKRARHLHKKACAIKLLLH